MPDVKNPPWGDPENFDAEKAWELIQTVRASEKSALARAKDAEEKFTEMEQQVSGLTAQIEESTSTLTARDSELTAERFERTRDRLALERGIPIDLAAKINASDEESLTSGLDALAAFRGNSGEITPAPRPTDPAQVATPAHDPEAQAIADAEAFFSN